MNDVIIKPKGGAYIFGIAFMYVFLLAMFAFGVIWIADRAYWALVLLIPPAVLIALLSRGIAYESIKITDSCIFAPVNIHVFTVKKRVKKIDLEGVNSIGYFADDTGLFISAIALRYVSGKAEHFKVNNFGAKQINKLKSLIKERAEILNSFSVQTEPDRIQKVFKKKRRK